MLVPPNKDGDGTPRVASGELYSEGPAAFVATCGLALAQIKGCLNEQDELLRTGPG